MRQVSAFDLYHALRLGLEGRREDVMAYLRRMVSWYPDVPELRELYEKHYDPLSVLREEKTEEQP